MKPYFIVKLIICNNVSLHYSSHSLRLLPFDIYNITVNNIIVIIF